MALSKQEQTPIRYKMLVLNIAPELKEDLIDYLIALPDIKGFTSYSVHGHGDHTGLSIAEMVTGRRKREQYEILLDKSLISPVLMGIEKHVGKDIVYWEQTIENFGRIK